MKKNTYMAILGVTLFVLSCQEKITFKELTWKENISLTATPDSLRNFVVAIDADGMPVGMLLDELTVQLKLDWEGDNPVKQVTLYIQLEENIDGNKKAYGVDTEIELGVITDFNEDGRIEYVLKSDEVYALFSPAFNGSRDQYAVPVLPGDNFEITWKITGADGTTSDVRNECLGAGCQYGFAVESGSATVNWWNGTFNYEWKEASADVLYYSYGDIEIGTTGSIDITATENSGESTVSHTLFNYYWDPADATGLLTFNEATGAVSLTGDMEEAWIISNINGSSLDIDWTYTYGGEYGKVTLTRTDGKNWPTNINTPLGEATEAEVWNGTYNFEYLEVGPGVAAYSYYNEIFVGYAGTVDCATEIGVPSVSHGAFDYWYDAPWEVTLTYDHSSGLVAIATPADFTWAITNVTERTIDIFYDFNSGYEEYATIRLTRTGNYDWPSNLHTE